MLVRRRAEHTSDDSTLDMLKGLVDSRFLEVGGGASRKQLGGALKRSFRKAAEEMKTP